LKSMMELTTKAHHLLNRAQQEAEYELEASNDRAWSVYVFEGLEGGFMSIHRHALILSTIVRLIEIVKSSFRSHVNTSLLWALLHVLNSPQPHTHYQLAVVQCTASTLSKQARYDLWNTRRLQKPGRARRPRGPSCDPRVQRPYGLLFTHTASARPPSIVHTYSWQL
jgi:hypothetical protein